MSEPTAQAHVEVEESSEPRSSFNECRRAERELTHHVRLVLDNDRDLYERRRAIVGEHLAASDACVFCNGSGFTGEIDGKPDDERECEHCDGKGTRPRYPHQLGDRLRDWCEELAGLDINENDLLSMLAREVLSTALAWVDWSDLADGYIEEEQES